MSISSSTKRPRVLNLNLIENTKHLKALEWYDVDRSSSGLKRNNLKYVKRPKTIKRHFKNLAKSDKK